ncbi:MAG: pantoate--beta-alanine ligase [bacterium]
MEILVTIQEMREWVAAKKAQRKKIGFVPTMGFLHKGHLELIKRARAGCGAVVVSIFVNPMQFGRNEDFSAYPKDLERDQQLAEWAGTDVIFLPEAEEIYPPDFLSYVEVPKLSEVLCGAERPGHFRGVCTVIAKFLNLIQPDELFLGEKDAQQLLILETMIRDLNFPVAVVSVPTVREADGLALSSRNSYLNAKERQAASFIYKALTHARDLIRRGEFSAPVIISEIKRIMSSHPQVAWEYVEVVDAKTLEEVIELKGDVMIAVAAHVGKARLIDNLRLRVG